MTIPVARRVQIYVYNNWGREAFLYFVLLWIAIGSIGLLYFLIFKLRVRSPSHYTWLFVITGLYVYFTLKLKNIPEEAVHFLEYGLLSFFLFRALLHHVKNKSIYLTATFLALLIGTFDEIIQWIIPQRYWDFRDAGLNGLSGGLFQMVLWKVIRPKEISGKITSYSITMLSLSLASSIFLFGLCASNTPSRVNRYTRIIPALSFLQKEEAMSEFGFKYKDHEIGVFYSRLSPNQLKAIDRKKGKEYAKILNENSNVDYEKFIKDYNPINNPFLHEVRVHIFRRDIHYEKGKNSLNYNEKKESYFIAYKENLILEKYYTQSIKNSIYSWDEKKINETVSFIEKNNFYESPVSANLFTTFSERTMWISILMALTTLVLFNLYYHREEKRRTHFY